jgi:hypothetical protein
MRKTDLTDSSLCAAIAEMATGLIDADLGGGIVKKRVALPGRGKSGSTRTLSATNKGNRWFFVFGFEKNDRSTVDDKELEALQKLAAVLLRVDAKQLEANIDRDELKDICHAR